MGRVGTKGECDADKQCFEYFVSQKLPCIMVKIVVIHKRNVTLTSMALLLLLSLIQSGAWKEERNDR